MPMTQIISIRPTKIRGSRVPAGKSVWPSREEIKKVLAVMPALTPIEKRDRALIAFALITGARDGALASFRLKHVDMARKTLFQDARQVRTKRRKTFTSTFFPVGSEPEMIVADYLAMLA